MKELFDAARANTVTVVNTTLIELYWNIGEYVSRPGEGVVEQLSAHIARKPPWLAGFTPV